MIRVCIVNAHWSNRGDEAALRPIINYIYDNYADIELTVIFKDRKEVQQFPYPNTVKHFSAQYLPKSLEEVENAIDGKGVIDEKMMSVIDTIRNTNLIIYSPGGAVISDRFWWRKQIEYLVPFICAEKYDIPIVVAAPSMGPFNKDSKKNCYIKKRLSCAKVLCVRENISAGYLQKIGIDNIVTTIDTAFYDDPDMDKNSEILSQQEGLKRFFDRYERVVAITLSDFLWHVEYMNKKDMLGRQRQTTIKFLEYLNHKGYGVLFVPQLFGNQNDRMYLRKFTQENSLILSDMLDTYFQQYIISKCYAVIGMRYHSNIFAAKMGIPFIAIGYEEKMYGFMLDWNLDDYLVMLDEYNYDYLLTKWKMLEINYCTYKSQLVSNREIWRNKAVITMASIKNEIERIKESM